MKLAFIKSPAKALVPVCAALAMLSPGAQAESTYGYNAAGTGPVSATAKVDLKVNVPLLILLRVGQDNTAVDLVTLTAKPNAVPGGVTTLADGNSQGSAWDGTAPVLAATSNPTSLTAYAWTNASGGGELKGAISTPMTTGGPALADITVTSSTGATNLLHPGGASTNLGALGTAANFPRNSVRTSTWTYGLTATALDNVAAGSYTATITYTATTL